MNGEMIIRNHNFEDAKQRLKKLIESEGIPAVDISVPVEKDVGERWLGFFTGDGIGKDHKVTGAKFNDFQAAVNKAFTQVARGERNIILQLFEVYKAFDALDKEYIAGFLTAISTAQQGVDEAREAQKNIEQAAARLAETVDVLLDFKSEMRGIRHLTDVDAMYDDTNDLRGAIGEQRREFGTTIQQQHNEIRRQAMEIKRASRRRYKNFRPSAT